jgi:hypothetical protein
MLRAIALAGFLALASCDQFSPEKVACKEWVLGRIKSPATFQVVSIEATNVKDYHSVSIEFDSQNGFGALIRSRAICRFKDFNGKPSDMDEAESVIIDGNFRG